ncbi:MAG TPA: shikimate kinase [Chthoniobacterales bacterium]|jgi:shikimate kinase|nr:shikimate kinase [Chthoniobacterales bacterium]
MNSVKSIVLVGMMGAGKSSVGRCLQRRTGLARLDTDEIVAKEFGVSIREIFRTHGEQKFRDAETQALGELAPDRPTIIVTGGGIVLRPQNVDLLKRLGTIVWLNADEATLFERASRRNERPLLQNENPRTAFSELLRKRIPLYRSTAHFEIDTSRMTHDEVAEAILSRLEEFSATRQ